MTESSVPPDWTPPKWVAVFSKRELQHLASTQHDRIQQLQIQNQAMRQQLALYQERERTR